MSRTVKSEWHNPDGFHIGNRLERKARPAGAVKKAFEEDLELNGIQLGGISEDDLETLESMEYAEGFGWI